MESVLGGTAALLLLGVLVLTASAVGARLVRRLEADERAVAGFALGMAMVSTLTTVLLLARLPAEWILPAALAAGALWARVEVLAALRACRDWLAARRHSRGWARVFDLLLAAYGILGVVGCWAPETGWDTGVYHFALARQRAEEGWLVVHPDILYSYMPAGMESLQTVGFLFGGEPLASLVNFSFYFAGLGLARLWAGRAGGQRAALIASFGYLASVTYVLRMGGGDVEVGQAVYLGLALYALWRTREGGMPGGRLLVGAGLGMALAVKYAMAWAVLGTAVVWLVLRRLDRRPLRATLADFGLAGLVAATVACPCYLRNLVLTGNPAFPFGSALEETFMPKAPEPFGGLRALFNVLRFDAFVLAAIPALAAASTRGLRWLVPLCILFFVPVVRQTGVSEAGLANAARFASPLLLPLLVVAGVGIAEVAGRRGWLRVVAVLFLGGTVAFAAAAHGERNRRKAAVALGLRPRDAYLEERINSYWAMRRAERELPEGRKVLLVEQRSYYCRAPFVQASDRQGEVTFSGLASGRDLRALLDRLSIGIIVYSHSPEARTHGFAGMLARSPSILADAGVEVLETRRDCTLYRLR